MGLKILLFPFSAIYGIVVFVRNKLFDWGLLKSVAFQIPVVSIGNITVGGTGKTPLTEYILRLLFQEYKVAVLSRGYKRKTKGHVVSELNSVADEIGDEPCQIKQKFPNAIVAVNESRVDGIKRICADFPDIDVILLDDAFQHRYVKPGLSIVLSDYGRPVYDDCLLPAGRLREGKSAINRADAVIVTKCPDQLNHFEQDLITRKLNLNDGQAVFFTKIKYGDPKPVFEGVKKIESISGFSILLLTGIANPKPLRDYICQLAEIKDEAHFADHHLFNLNDLKTVRAKFDKITDNQKIILTTEKDAVRLRNISGVDKILIESLYFVPIEICFINQSENEFNLNILNYVRENKRNSRLY
jgi:tetraacyldisaccharide 4'-kinase